MDRKGINPLLINALLQQNADQPQDIAMATPPPMAPETILPPEFYSNAPSAGLTADMNVQAMPANPAMAIAHALAGQKLQRR